MTKQWTSSPAKRNICAQVWDGNGVNVVALGVTEDDTDAVTVIAKAHNDIVASLEAENRFLREALRGGNADKDNADLIAFLADRLVFKYGEDKNTDYLSAARFRVNLIRAALKA